jgi:hypothetical protein
MESRLMGQDTTRNVLFVGSEMEKSPKICLFEDQNKEVQLILLNKICTKKTHEKQIQGRPNKLSNVSLNKPVPMSIARVAMSYYYALTQSNTDLKLPFVIYCCNDKRPEDVSYMGYSPVMGLKQTNVSLPPSPFTIKPRGNLNMSYIFENSLIIYSTFVTKN